MGTLHARCRAAVNLHDERSVEIGVGAQHPGSGGTALLRHLPHHAGAALMPRRTGSADLPLHGGRVPQWLGERMAKLGGVVTQAILHHYGRDEFLRRLANPFWFQSFGAVMGMDWHSSGITTSVIGALKRGLTPFAKELGVHICGGRGKYSRQTPHELINIGSRVGFNGHELAQTSRLVAK